MPVYRNTAWSRRLDDPGDPLAILERQRATIRQATKAAASEPIDVAEFVRATLDGAAADIDLPTSYGARSYPLALSRQIQAAIVARLHRPMTTIELALLHFAMTGEWSRRASLESQAAAFTRRERTEWLPDYQGRGAA